MSIGCYGLEHEDQYKLNQILNSEEDYDFYDEEENKELNLKSIIVENICQWDYPDFSDAYVSYAEWTDGTELTAKELVRLNDDGNLISEIIFDNQLYLGGI